MPRCRRRSRTASGAGATAQRHRAAALAAARQLVAALVRGLAGRHRAPRRERSAACRAGVVAHARAALSEPRHASSASCTVSRREISGAQPLAAFSRSAEPRISSISCGRRRFGIGLLANFELGRGDDQIDQVGDRRDLPAADVVCARIELDRGDVGARDIAHVSEVAPGVGAPGLQHGLALAARLGFGDLAGQRAEDVLVGLARTGVVEDAGADDAQAVSGRVLLPEEVAAGLRDRVRIARVKRGVLGDRQRLRRPVDLARAREQRPRAGRLGADRVEEVDGRAEVHRQRLARLVPRSRGRSEPREVEDALRPVRGHIGRRRLAVEQVELGPARGKHLLARGAQQLEQMGAREAAAAGDERRAHRTSLSSRSGRPGRARAAARGPPRP